MVKIYSFDTDIDVNEIAKITIYEVLGVEIKMKDGKVFTYKK